MGLAETRWLGAAAVVLVVFALATGLVFGPSLSRVAGSDKKLDIFGSDPSMDGVSFRVLPGWTAEETGRALEQLRIVDSRAFLAAARNPETARQALGEVPASGTLEGYLLPDTYRIFSVMTAEDIVLMMARNFKESFQQSFASRLGQAGLDRERLVAIAATVEHESAPPERKKYASMLLNRMKAGLALSVNAEGDLGMESPSSGRDLAPAGASPSLKTMNDVLEAPLTSYLYAVRRPDGFHAYAATPEEYLRLKDRFTRSRAWIQAPPPSEAQPDPELQKLLEALAKTRLGYTAVVVRDLTSGRFAAVNEKTQFTTASLWKLPLLVATLQARDSGELTFDDLLGGELGTVGDAVQAVAETSDNEAAYSLLERLGHRRVQSVVEQLGLISTELRPGGGSLTTALDMAQLLARVAMRDFLKERSSDELRDLLILGKGALHLYVPNHVPIAAKVGRLNDYAHDVGILYTEKSVYIIAVMTRGFPQRGSAEEAIACISKTVYDYLLKDRAPSDDEVDPRLSGFILPIKGAWVPSQEFLLPGAPHPYRSGMNEGIDFANGDSCVPVHEGTPVVAVKDGTIVRADHDFTTMTSAEFLGLLERERQGYSDSDAQDRFAGRQIWIDHGEGVVTWYSHLSAIEEDIQEGVAVEAGQTIGYVGNSGTVDGVLDSEADVHLDFELRLNGEYLGKGLSPIDVKRLLFQVFSQG